MAISFQGPKLYKLTSTGKIQYWRVFSTDNSIVTVYGQVDGKEQRTEDIIKSGKNLDRSNATTVEQQAYAEAKALHEKKLKKGYVDSIQKAKAGKVDVSIEGGIFPMLAQRFDEQGHKIVYPAYVQPKFDGHRCIAVVESGVVTLWSRTRKAITGLPHINKAIADFVSKNNLGDIILDGEIYNHDYRDKFEDLTSFIRSQTAKPGHEICEYHIYDIANDKAQSERLKTVNLFKKAPKPLVAVQNFIVLSEEEAFEAFESFVNKGYEGAIIRNGAALYVNKRSYDLQKIKEFADDEFKVVDVVEGRGKLAGHAIFVLETKEKVLFKAKMKGLTSDLQKYWQTPALAIGKWMTVQYQGFTGTSNVPRFPVAIRFKEDI